MKRSNIIKSGMLLTTIASVIPAISYAGFVEDGVVRLDLRNFYLNRDFDGTTPDVGSWSQGIDVQYFSGYTDTAIQVGLDASGQQAYKFHSEGNDGTLPYDTSAQEAKDDYGRAGVTLKLKYSKTELKIGDHRPHLPVAWDDTSRQLDTIYEGAVLQSDEIDGLSLTLGRFWEVVTRNSSDKEKMYLYPNFNGKRSDGLDFAGATYQLSDALSATYFYGNLKDIYTQNYFGIEHKMALTDSINMKTDVRYFDNQDEGKALYGSIDGSALGARLTFTSGSHMLAVSYQEMDSDWFFPTLNGYVPQPFLLHWSNAAFINADEKSMGIRYGYDFTAAGAAGLNLFTQYIKGTDIDIHAGGPGSAVIDDNAWQSERDFVLSYQFQNPMLKGLGLQWQNIDIKKSFTDGYMENRLVATYTTQF